MSIELNRDGLCLKRRQVVKLRGAIGHIVVCDSGSVWVTQDGDARDVVLSTDESFTLDRNGPVLVQAFEQSAITVRQPDARARAFGLPAFLRAGIGGAGVARGSVRT